MDRKRFLISTTGLLLVTGLLLASAPFIASLRPSARADAVLPRIDLSEVPPGSYKLIPHPINGKLYQGYNWAVFIYRKLDGELKVWDIPIRNGAVGMPDLHWWRPFFDCKKFGPSIVKGTVDESLPIQCHDKNLPSEWWTKEWRWDIEGKNLGNNISDLIPTKGVVEGKYFVFAKTS